MEAASGLFLKPKVLVDQSAWRPQAVCFNRRRSIKRVEEEVRFLI